MRNEVAGSLAEGEDLAKLTKFQEDTAVDTNVPRFVVRGVAWQELLIVDETGPARNTKSRLQQFAQCPTARAAFASRLDAGLN